MPLAARQLSYFCDFVYRRSAIVLTPEKEYLIEGRLAPVARARGLASVDALITALRTEAPGKLHAAVVEAMTTNETTFFRDQHPFDALRQELIPRMKKLRASQRSLVIMCAACSTGQEPYSIAMTLAEPALEMAAWSVRVLGVDLSEAVLARAREGIYQPFEVSRGLTAQTLAKHFDAVDGGWQLKRSVRDKVELRQMNLVEPWPSLPRVDVMFMRNVLIYFDVPTKKAILAQVRKTLAPDGYLLLGAAETTLNVDDAFERVTIGPSTAYRMVAQRV